MREVVEHQMDRSEASGGVLIPKSIEKKKEKKKGFRRFLEFSCSIFLCSSLRHVWLASIDYMICFSTFKLLCGYIQKGFSHLTERVRSIIREFVRAQPRLIWISTMASPFCWLARGKVKVGTSHIDALRVPGSH
jgi:hypothetical protein